MTPEERFERIERDLANTAAINAETAAMLNAFIKESREGRKNLEATMKAFLEAMMGRKNGKTE